MPNQVVLVAPKSQDAPDVALVFGSTDLPSGEVKLIGSPSPVQKKIVGAEPVQDIVRFNIGGESFIIKPDETRSDELAIFKNAERVPNQSSAIVILDKNIAEPLRPNPDANEIQEALEEVGKPKSPIKNFLLATVQQAAEILGFRDKIVAQDAETDAKAAAFEARKRDEQTAKAAAAKAAEVEAAKVQAAKDEALKREQAKKTHDLEVRAVQIRDQEAEERGQVTQTTAALIPAPEINLPIKAPETLTSLNLLSAKATLPDSLAPNGATKDALTKNVEPNLVSPDAAKFNEFISQKRRIEAGTILDPKKNAAEIRFLEDKLKNYLNGNALVDRQGRVTPATLKAIGDFQEASGLNRDNVLGVATADFMVSGGTGSNLAKIFDKTRSTNASLVVKAGDETELASEAAKAMSTIQKAAAQAKNTLRIATPAGMREVKVTDQKVRDQIAKLYDGNGPMTADHIKAYQALVGEPQTGKLVASQLRKLINAPVANNTADKDTVAKTPRVADAGTVLKNTSTPVT